MNLYRSAFIGVTLLIFSIGCSKAQIQNISHTYVNPVLAMDFPDPAIIRTSNGIFYAYATQGKNQAGYPVNIQLAKSSDLIHWEYIGEALPVTPEWGKNKNQYWAPTVSFDAGKNKYFMYYSVENNAGGKCIGVALSDKPEGPFTDVGEPMVCGEGFINIDPMAFDDPQTGKKLLYWGSGLKAIKVQELDDSRTKFKEGSTPLDVIPVNYDKDYDELVEGAWVIFHEGYYYIFYSGNNCCGLGTHYAVMIARSKSAFGPFEHLSSFSKSGTSVILGMSNQWIGPGHNSTITDDAGNDWILYHAVQPKNKAMTFREMLIDRITWLNGWPIIETGKPSFLPQPSPIIK